MPMWKCKRAHRKTKSPIYEGRNICAGGEKGRVSWHNSSGFSIPCFYVLPPNSLVQFIKIFVSGKDSCGGDSGGPLVIKKRRGLSTYSVQIGIVSWGLPKCGTAGVPGVYTNVGHFMNWILDNIEEWEM